MAAVCAGGAAAEPTWNLEQPPPPAGRELRRPAGQAGRPAVPGAQPWPARCRGQRDRADAACTSTTATGWHQLSTVCGGPGRTTRIAIAEPARVLDHHAAEQAAQADRGHRAVPLPRRRGGRVLQHAAPVARPVPGDDAPRLATARPTAGSAVSAPPTRPASGGEPFHLHWDGAALRTVYAPQGRGVTDLEAHVGDTFFETVRIGKSPGDSERPARPLRARAAAAPDPQDHAAAPSSNDPSP